MIWNPFKEREVLRDKNDLATLKVMGTYEPSIQRVRDLEILGNLEEAEGLFDAMAKVCLAVSIESYELFKTLVRFHEELIRRGKFDKADTLLSRLRASPFSKDKNGEAIVNSLALNLTNKNNKRANNTIFYCCQKCGEPILHLTTPCDSCGFLPLTRKEMVRGVVLSSTSSLSAAIVFQHGALVRANQVRTNSSKEIDAAYEKALSDGSLDFLVGQLLAITRDINPLSYRLLKNTTMCISCGKEYLIYPPYARCTFCASLETKVEPIQLYKVTIQSVLRWLQDFAEYQEQTTFRSVISDLISLKEDAIQFGRLVTPETGIPIQRKLEQMSPIITRRGLDKWKRLEGKYRVTITAFGSYSEQLYVDGHGQVAARGYASDMLAFDALSCYLRQGVVL